MAKIRVSGACVFLFVIAASFGCGGVAWDGRYTGTLTVTGSCSDGFGGPAATSAVDWTVVKNSTGLEIKTGGNCGSLAAVVDASGSTAALRGKFCASGGGASVVPYVVTGGTVSLDGDSLHAIVSKTIPSGTATGSCNTVSTGMLTRTN